MYGYVAYSAFAISRTLPVRLYRRQALGIGLVAVVIAVNLIPTEFYPNPSGTLSSVYLGLLFAAFLVIFYWIDASVRGARFTDPLLRDTLRWSRVRIAFWVYYAVATPVFLFVAFRGQLSLQDMPFRTAVAVNLTFFIVFFAGVIVLPIASRRSKDRTLRKHLNWFGVFAAAIFSFNFVVGPIIGGPSNFLGGVVGSGLVFAIEGLLLYPCVRSLVPLYSFATEDTPK